MLDQTVEIQKGLADRLIASLRQGGFVLYRQEIIALGRKRPERPFQEILIRFREEEEKLLPPGTFFPILEEYRLLPFVDRWVVSQLARRMQASYPGTGPMTRCSINLSADTLHDPNFVEYTRKHMEHAGLQKGTMAFEVSWDTAVTHLGKLRTLAGELQAVGCRLSVAGFDGSDKAFDLLRILRPDFVKLGYALVQHVTRSPADSDRTAAANFKCHGMGIRTIAEHVESVDVLEKLRQLEVDFAQGLVISPPRPVN